jgi:3-hydroxyisobutyrate dehydrogenase
MPIGFAGLGRMGGPMARNLINAGYPVTLWNRSTDKAAALADDAGAAIAASPRELADRCEVVITMLADDASSERVHCADDGLFAGSAARTFIEMGTHSPAHLADLRQRAPDGARVIDAPVSGSTQAARDGQLMIMAGCDAATLEPVKALLDVLGKQTMTLGQPGAGAVMKLAVNSMIHGINQNLAEAMSLAEAAGIAPEAAFDVIEASAACAPMLKYRRPLYLDEGAHEVTFTVTLAKKDMQITAALAAELGTQMPQGAVTLERLQRAEAAGYAERDMAAMLAFNREDKTP